MRRAGASSSAVAFARRIDSQGYLADFRDSGRVDVGWAVYPFRANENRVCLLLNGEPATIDVDEISRFRPVLAASLVFAAFERTHPGAAVFPGDRFHSSAIIDESLPGGGQRFLVPYLLRDGCHACALLGRLLVAFEFDAAGRLVGTAVNAVRPERD
jgi:hypothetical protein